MKELLKKFKEIKMTAEEKNAGFKQLQSFINQNPIKTNVSIKSPFYSNIFIQHKILASAFAIVIIVSATSGTSIAAKYSIPGDNLYPVKINLTEKLETLTAITPEEKAIIEAKHLDNRLGEAEILSNQNKLENGVQEKVKKQITQNLEEAVAHVETLKSNGETENAKKIKISLEKSLQKHKDVVDEILKSKKQKKSVIKDQKETSENRQNVEVSSFSAQMRVAEFTEINNSTTTQETTEKRGYQTKMNDEDNETPLLRQTLETLREEKED